MAYDLHNEKGFAGPGPSIGGLRNLRSQLSHQDVLMEQNQQLASLLEHGYAPHPLRLKNECLALMKTKHFTPDVLSTIQGISKAAANSKSIVILHDHIG